MNVLVVHANFAVGAAVAQRLIDFAVVHLVSCNHAPDETTRYDVVVLCPYLTGEEKESLRTHFRRRTPPPAVIEIRDTQSGPRLDVAQVGAQSTESIDAILGALAMGSTGTAGDVLGNVETV